MKTISLREIYKVLNIRYDFNNDYEITRITNDITKIKDQTVVFHVKKDIELNVNEFQKLKSCFIVTDQPTLSSDSLDIHKFIFVTNVQKAYQDFIAYYRNLFSLPVVAITGTCGKTTIKEIIKQILEKNHRVAATIGNQNHLGYNNDYLFSIDSNTDFGVFETAISYPGNLITGCDYFKPTIGVISNIGIDHLNGCKTIDTYIRTKGEMLAGLQYKGILILNNDDENIKKINLSPFKGSIITFGINNKADFSAEQIKYSDYGMEFTLIHKDSKFPAYTPGLGIHNVYNALAAIAVLTALGMDIEESIKMLSSVKLIRSHLEYHAGYNQSTILDDTWSSNPTSLKAALEVLKEKGKGKIKIVTLGKISYLGEYAEEQYEKIGKMMVDYGVDFIITIDSQAKKIGENAKKHGLKPEFHLHCKSNIEVKSCLECLLDKNTIVLFKTSMLEPSIQEVIKQLIIDDGK